MASIFQGSRNARAGMPLESNNPVMQGGEGIEYFKTMKGDFMHTLLLCYIMKKILIFCPTDTSDR